MKTFTTAARRVRAEPIEFDLDGTTYHFTPPKTVSVYLGAIEGGTEMVASQLNWLDAGLPREEAEQIKNRLLDFDDDLEAATLLEIVGWLLKESTGRPTGPSPE